MLYLKWFIFEILSLVMQYLINLPFAPVFVLFATSEAHLPKWLAWFDTYDNTLDGDDGWKAGTRPYKNETNSYQRWINRFHWLWRNSCYGFARSVLGIRFIVDDTIQVVGSPLVSNGPPGQSGLVKRYLMRNGKKLAFQWYYIRQYKRWPNHCVRVNIGWKLWDIKAQYAMHVFSPSPGMHFLP